MSLDAYSLCPGGTGKKIKFCCGDFLPELQKIDRMMEGEQYQACLKHIDHLLEQPSSCDRPCLLASKCLLLRATEQFDAARAAAALFQEKHPNNQIALAENAIHAVAEDPRAALEWIQRAIRVAAGALAGRTYQAIGVVAGALFQAGLFLPARALLELQSDLVENDEQPTELLTALSRANDIPLLLRVNQSMFPCPEGSSWANRYDEAMQAVGRGDWQSGAELLTALAADVPQSPVIWRSLATLRGYLADNAAAIDALRKYAAIRASETDGLEDAVEAEAAAMFLADDPLGDRLDICNLVWTINDAERAQEAFLSASRLRTVPFDPARFSDGQSPPPKAAFMVLDRTQPESAAEFNLDTAPRLIGQAMLFGRQTDCEARLEVLGVAADEIQLVADIVAEAAGKVVEPDPKKEVVGHWSASQKLLRADWQPPRDISPERLRELLLQHKRKAVLEQWPGLKLGIFDGRAPREVAAAVGRVANLSQDDKTLRIRLLAAILVLEHFSQRLPGQLYFNELRAQFGLPLLGTINPRQQSVETLPPTRLSRLNPADLSDKDLVFAYFHAGVYAIRPALRKFAEAIVERPSLAQSNERLQAYASLVRTEEDLPRALEILEQGRRAAEAKKLSSASWDLMELSLRIAAHDGQSTMRLIEHIHKHHLGEPGVANALTRMLIDVGLINPDGTPAFVPGSSESAMADDEPDAEPSGLWTPDSAESGGGGKLWTPE